MKNGMGMSDLKLGDKTFYGYGGGMDGFRTMVLYLPEEKLAVAYSSNGVVHPAQDILRVVVDIYRSKPFEIPTFLSKNCSFLEWKGFCSERSEALDKNRLGRKPRFISVAEYCPSLP
jgi:hypothetical protein